MRELLEYLIKQTTGVEEFTIEENEEDGKSVFEVKVDPEQIGLIIGKGGNTIKTIQELLQIKGRLEDHPVFVNVSEA